MVLRRPKNSQTGKKNGRKKWNKSKSTADREALKENQRAFNDLCEVAKTE